jgi:hypothetical protein
MAVHESLIVTRRFRGPTTSANGGYVSGRLAALAPYAVTVRLMKPPPLETALEAVEAGGRLELRRGDIVLAEARPADAGDLAPPLAPSFDEAVEATSRYAGFSKHFAPECFVCGPARAPGDGLRLFAGPLAHPSHRDPGHRLVEPEPTAPIARAVVAAPWIPDPSLDAGDGCAALEFVWAALDCPGYLAVAGDMRAMLLGELTADVRRRVRIGEPCRVVGWPIRSSGRKHEAGTAVYGADGDLCAIARALWIEPRTAP